MVFRALNSADAEEVFMLRGIALQTEPQAFGATYDSFVSRGVEGIREQIVPIPGHRLSIGAFDGDRLVGTATVSRPTNEKFSHTASLGGMFVLPQYRGQGVGRALVSMLIAEAKMYQGLEQIGLSVSQSQKHAIKLYQSAGFATWGVEPNGIKVEGISSDLEHMILKISSEECQG